MSNNRVSISRSDFLDSFVQLYHAIKDYDELITLCSNDSDLDSNKLRSIIQNRMNNLEFGSVNVRGMEIIGAYVRSTLANFKGDKLNFLLPDNPDDDFFAVNKGYLELSKTIEVIEEELKEIEEKIYFLSGLLPPHNIQKIQLLLKAIASFFKSIVRKDSDDMAGHINHMHHLTASKESYFVINDIGRMVRDIYNSIEDFSSHVTVEEIDPSLVDDMPDAIDKLNLVIRRMENAANSTLDDVENLLEKNAKDLEVNIGFIDQCTVLENKLMEMKNQHQELGEEIDTMIDNMKNNLLNGLTQRIQGLKDDATVYMDIMSNQSFQDITGQTIKKIISFIEHLEFNLLQILQKYGGRLKEPKEKTTQEDAVSPLVGTEFGDGQILEGPQDNKPTKQVVAKQGDVDKMLAEFGF